MIIKSLTLDNYRLYRGSNTFEFSTNKKKPIALVSGLNGYGKTSFVHSIAWCLYGNLLVQVDEQYRKEIYNSGGYNKFRDSQLNRSVLEDVQAASSYSVRLELNEVKLPGVLNSTVVIIRSVDVDTNGEKLEIFIDGVKNQLTEEVGYEEFINEYILSREIAKFFFFDSEKIVDLADIQREDNKRSLFTAYSKVLGLSAYLELQKTLENLVKRLKKESLNKKDFTQVNSLELEVEEISNSIEEKSSALEEIITKLEELRKEQLLNQAEAGKIGLSIEGTDLVTVVNDIADLREQINQKKSQLNQYLTYLPFLSGYKILTEVGNKVTPTTSSSHEIEVVMTRAHDKLISQIGLLEEFSSEIKNSIIGKINSIYEGELKALDKRNKNSFVVDDDTYMRLEGLLKDLKFSVSESLKQTINSLTELTHEERLKKSRLSDYDKFASSDIASKKVERFKSSQIELELLIEQKSSLEYDLRLLKGSKAKAEMSIETILKSKRLSESNIQKRILAEKTIGDISTYLERLKKERKSVLEKILLATINELSHKKWISNLSVDFSNNMLEVSLFGADGIYIDKSKLSKGEQQLYASAILVSLINESSIDFPVIMDSPLQKLDKQHATNFIKNLYPLLGSQIILLPLLEKELQEMEYHMIYPNISDTYLIVNHSGSSMVLNSSKADLYKNFNTALNNG